NLHAPSVCDRVARLAAEVEQQGVRQRQNLFLFLLTLRPQIKLHVHRIGVTDGNSRLEPLKLHFPFASERIRAGAESAAIIGHVFSVANALLYSFSVQTSATVPGARIGTCWNCSRSAPSVLPVQFSTEYCVMGTVMRLTAHALTSVPSQKLPG